MEFFINHQPYICNQLLHNLGQFCRSSLKKSFRGPILSVDAFFLRLIDAVFLFLHFHLLKNENDEEGDG